MEIQMAPYDEAALRRLRKSPLEKPIALPPRVMSEGIPAPYRKDFFGWPMGHKPDLAFINIRADGNVEASCFHEWRTERAMEAGCPGIMNEKAPVCQLEGLNDTDR
jgi:hypothetical protein